MTHLQPGSQRTQDGKQPPLPQAWFVTAMKRLDIKHSVWQCLMRDQQQRTADVAEKQLSPLNLKLTYFVERQIKDAAHSIQTGVSCLTSVVIYTSSWFYSYSRTEH